MSVSAVSTPQLVRLEQSVSEESAAACQAVLYCLREDTRDVVAAGLVDSRGAQIASVRREETPAFSAEKVAALTGSIAETALALTCETGLGPCRSLILDADDGRTLLLAVPAGRTFFWLFVTAGEGALLGQVVLHARECQDSLSEILEAEEAAREMAARAAG